MSRYLNIHLTSGPNYSREQWGLVGGGTTLTLGTQVIYTHAVLLTTADDLL